MENNIILYSNEHEKVSINVAFLNDTFWLPQKGIAELFGVEVPAINKHLANIYESGELTKEATISILEIVQTEGSLDILPNAGQISHEQAIEKATAEYEQFRIEQDKKYISDLDRALEKAKSKK